MAAAGSTAEGSPEGASLAGASELQQTEIPKKSFVKGIQLVLVEVALCRFEFIVFSLLSKFYLGYRVLPYYPKNVNGNRKPFTIYFAPKSFLK